MRIVIAEDSVLLQAGLVRFLTESGHEVVARYEAVLGEVADGHRGESVLVISHGGVMCLALSALAQNLALSHSRDLPMPNCGVVAMEGDADGWAARSWGISPGSHSGHRISGFSLPYSIPTVVPSTPGNFPNIVLKLRFSNMM